MKHFTRQFLLMAALLIASAAMNFGGGVAFAAAESWSYPTSKPGTPFGGGTGTQSDPYRISTAQQLANLAYMVNDGEYYKGKYFKLTTDITLNDNVLNEDGTPNMSANPQAWTPIGEYGIFWDDDFMGTFDGCGHTIRGLYMTKLDEDAPTVLYMGLFGSIKNAVLKNINFEDCLISFDNYSPTRINMGILCATSYQSSCININVSKSLISYNKPRTINAGGIIGECYNNNTGVYNGLYLANSSFDGTISMTNCTGNSVNMHVGGLVGIMTYCDGDGIIDCTSKGKICVESLSPTYNQYVFKEHIGGVLGYAKSDYSGISQTLISNCVNYTDIHFQSSLNDAEGKWSSVQFWLSPFANNTDYYKLKNCVNFGNVYIGKKDVVCSCDYVFLYGMLANEMEDCANYGNIIFEGNFEDRDPYSFLVGMRANNYTRCINVQTQNNIPNLGGQMIVNPFSSNGGAFTATDCHYYFHNENTAGNAVLYDISTSGVTKHTDTSDFTKTGPFFTSGGWGVVKKEDGYAYNGYPMPVVCGGAPAGYDGNGESESTAYIINTEADLNNLKEYVKNGNMFEGKYFKLGSDISMSRSMESIGTSTYPFKGIFDGNGHAIVGLRNTLFDYMYGTVKNLAIVDCDINALVTIGALARYVGSSDYKAEISNCYVNGTVYTTSSTDIKLAGFCYDLYSGSSIHDCYFKGLFVPQNNGINGSYYISGIAYDGSSSTVGETTKPGIYNCYASFDVKASGSFTIKQVAGISNSSTSNSCSDCYAVSTSDFSNSGDCTKLSSELELNEKFSGKTGWLQGVYRPLLSSAKHYTATSLDDETAYFDAIPEANPRKNYIYNVTVSGDPYADKTVWELPNMAVYVESEQMDYITNGYLDQSANFKYNRASGATATAGQLRYDLKQTEKGYHLVCLPGVVEKSDLPEGTKVMIVGNVTPAEGTTQQVNVVMVEDIPAGVPCFVYVPTTTVTTGTIPLVMRSGIVTEPQNETYGSLKGTFSKDTSVPSGSCISAAYKEEDSKLPYFIRTTEATTAQPFTAWLTGANGDVKIVDYVLLDEENEAMSVTLTELNNQKTNLKMRRTLKTENWNTICLPYSLTSDEISTLFGSGTLVEAFNELVYNSESNTYTLKFTAATEMTAGTPYLIKPTTADADNIFEMQNKTIACASATTLPEGTIKTVNNTTLTMQGEYNHRTISPYEATDGKSLYVISGDKIFHVNSDVEMKGFRCYFVAEETVLGSGAKLFSGARLMHSDGTSTDLRLIKAEPTGDADAVYDLLGRKGDGQTKGVVIKNGKKVLKN